MPSVIASTPMLGRVMLIGSGVDTKVFSNLKLDEDKSFPRKTSDNNWLTCIITSICCPFLWDLTEVVSFAISSSLNIRHDRLQNVLIIVLRIVYARTDWPNFHFLGRKRLEDLLPCFTAAF
jgi:hypothetical protein